MNRFERRLRAERPLPREELVSEIARRLERTRPTGVPRVALAGALTVATLVAVGSVGGISYAASAAQEAVQAVRKIVKPSGAIVVQGISAGGDQYRPGYGFGDPNHNHTGPPGLTRSGGEAAPPIRSRGAGDRKARIVSFRVRIDEQASLRIHVFGEDGRRLLLTQRGSVIGRGISGRQTKTIRYTVRVPRSIPIRLRIPANLLRRGETYTVRVVALDPDGNRSELLIPFIA